MQMDLTPIWETQARASDDTENLVGRYFTRTSYLHRSCFYDGMCGADTERRIRQTLDYIEDAERLAVGV